ncbi:MAG: ABC transporter permease [Caldilineaceae bacterium]|nr:ABC transporter permease [Caldilineaceae bacterium]
MRWKVHPLVTYLIQRLLTYLFTIFGSFSVAFIFFRMIPGNPIGALLNSMRQQYSYTIPNGEEMIAEYEKLLGLDGSWFDQYIRYVSNVFLRFDFGPSLTAFPTHAQVLILQALPWTLGLLGVSILIAWVLGVILGGIVGWQREFPGSQFITTVAIALAQVPQYFVALFLIFLFAYALMWLPARGAYPATTTPGPSLNFILGVLRHAILPACSIVLVSVSGWLISTRSLMISILGEDYLLFAQAKGLRPGYIFSRYALRNALLPQLTGLAISLGFIMNGSFLVEYIFTYPGIGTLFVNAIGLLDYNTVQGIVLISIIAVLTASLLLDLLLPLVDPRIRLGG